MATTKARPAKGGKSKAKAKARKGRKARTRRPPLRDTHATRGRPTLATAFLLFKVLVARREGLSIRYCGGPAGVNPGALTEWLKQAEEHTVNWHGKPLPKPIERAYLQMDGILRELADRWQAARIASQRQERHVQPDFSGIEDFRVTAVGHWLAFLDQWEAITAIYVRDLAAAIKMSPDWHAQAWLLERFAAEDFGRSDRISVGLTEQGELDVSLRIAPPVGHDAA